MFFLLSKTLDVLADPLWWGLGPALAGVALLWRGARRRLGAGLAFGGLGVLLLFSLPAVSNRLWASLEADAPRTVREGAAYDVVVLLGGLVSPLGTRPGEPAWNDNVERLLATRALLVSGRAKVAVVSGGGYGIAGLDTEAAYLAAELEALGVEKERLVVEATALNTRENAVEVGRLMQERGFSSALVVTSAFHMRRAMGCFRAAGVQADALPVDYRMLEPSRDPHVMPRAEYLRQSASAVREYVGRVVYRLAGYSKE